MAPHDCLIFDFGNVVGFFDHRRACGRLAELTGGRLSEDEVHERVFTPQVNDRFERGEVSSEEFVRELKRLLEIGAEDRLVTQAWSDIFWPNEPVIELLGRLRRSHHRLLLASNINQLHFRQIARQFDTALANFDELVLSHEVGARKPAAEFFERCLDRARLPAARCVFMDDREEFVQAARDAGMKGIVYRPEIDLTLELRELGAEI